MKLFDFQKNILAETSARNRVAYYLEMGTGKTYIGAEKLISLANKKNIIVCQKSKLRDWLDHMNYNYADSAAMYDGRKKNDIIDFINAKKGINILIINYDILFRRQSLALISGITLLLDESSLIQNDTAKRTKFILNRMNCRDIILLSGTPTNGKYEKLYSQLKLLGLKMSKAQYWNTFIDYSMTEFNGFPVKIVNGYKNVDDLKKLMRDMGCVFLKSEEVIDLPPMTEIPVYVPVTKEYQSFEKNKFLEIEGAELVGDTPLKKMLYARQLCGAYCKDKLAALRDLLESTEDRVIIFYCFNNELDEITEICKKLAKPLSVVNGKEKNLDEYEASDNAVTLVQYQAGAMGLNLQKSNKIIYFTLPLGKGSCGLWEQSKKRINRIGQARPCFYYYLLCRNSIELKNLESLRMGKDLTDYLFEGEK